MKITLNFQRIVRAGLMGLVTLASGLWTTSAAESSSFARIKSVRIERMNVVVEVEASTDFTKVTLESSTRVGRRAWLPRAVQLIDATESVAKITFSVPISPAIEILRVRGDLAESSLPAELYTGTNKFTIPGGGVPIGGMEYQNQGPVTSAPNTDSREGESARSVVESDIWKLAGDTLFFFNQYRGLQVIDVANPDAPEVTGTYDLPGAGEQMYVINGTNVLLLARDNCAWYGTESQSRVILLQVRDG